MRLRCSPRFPETFFPHLDQTRLRAPHPAPREQLFPLNPLPGRAAAPSGESCGAYGNSLAQRLCGSMPVAAVVAVAAIRFENIRRELCSVHMTENAERPRCHCFSYSFRRRLRELPEISLDKFYETLVVNGLCARNSSDIRDRVS